jgi:GTPase SAR1 family protein
MQGIQFAGWDLGGHEAVRHLWEDYVCEASAVMFLVDAADLGRLEECRAELDALVGEGVLKNVPLAVLLNKCDLVEAPGSEFLASQIGIEDVMDMHGERRVGLFRMSVYRGEGYQDAFRWIASFL